MPSTPTLSANPTAPTSGNVTVTVTYPADAEVKEYKISTDGTWTAYSVSVVLNANNTVYARCKDAAGNLSEVGSVIVSNIDKIAPSTPTLLANPTAPTSSSVTVTVTFPTDAAVKEYRIGTSAWSAYTVPVVLAANNTVYARCADSAGNLSEVGSIIVSNIDKIAPEKPALFKNPSTLTGGSVTVMITYPPDAAVKEYRIGIGAWIAYTAPVVLSANNTVTARCKDAAGNLSGENSITVDNIDKTPPGIPATPKAVSASYNSVKVTWAAAALATGYVVYRLNPSTGSYVRVKVTKALSYIDGSLTTGKTYTYMVRAYRTVGTVNVYGTPSASFTAKPIPATPANFKAVRYSSTSIKLTWSPVVGASGYVLYRYNASTQAWVRLKVQTATSYINTGLTNDVTYSYKVRAYRMVNSSPIYGNPTAAVSAKTF